MLEIFIVAGIVAVVLFLSGRSFFRTLAGKKEGKCCGCGSGACGNIRIHDQNIKRSEE